MRCTFIFALFFGGCGVGGPNLGKEMTQERANKGKERRQEEGWREGGKEEATERGIASSHCSIKSVGNDQDEMMAIFLL